MRKEWPDLRADIERARQELYVSHDVFAPIQPNDWQGIEEQIYREFCQLDHPTARPVWLWMTFKKDTAKLALNSWQEQENIILQLLDQHQRMWLMVNESFNNAEKFWFYECEIEAAMQILADLYYLDEFYLVDKKYNWIVAVDHHNILHVSGQTLAERLRNLTEQGEAT